jgi:hypothetical protein
VIALEACRVSPADRQKNGARKTFMPHIGKLWEASGKHWGWWKQFWYRLFAGKG